MAGNRAYLLVEMHTLSKNSPISPSVHLELTTLIGSGNDRHCWRHPLDDALCVKVAKPEQERPQNDIDYHYWCHLQKRNIRSKHMPHVHGWVSTNHGLGLVCEMIRQPDGSPSPMLLDAVMGRQISREHAVALVEQAFDWLIQYKVILADHDVDNMLVRQGRDGQHHLVFIDGLGARNFDMQYWVRRHVGFKAVWKAKEFRQRTLDQLNAACGLGRAGQHSVGQMSF